MIAMKHFLIVLVVQWWSHQDATVDAYNILLREMLQPFMTCADENGVHRDKSATSSLTNDISTMQIGYDAVVGCIQSKLPVLRESSDKMEWYIGHMFDITVTNRLQSNFSGYTADDLSCLDSDSQKDSRDTCFNSTYVTLTALYEASQRYNFTTLQESVHFICDGVSNFRPETCAKVGDPCVPDIKEFLSQVLFPVLAGRDCRTPTPTPKIVTSSTNIGRSALFACGDKVFNASLEQLFPPSESTVSRVTNTTAAMVQQKLSMQEFCAKRQQYATCVVQRVKNSYYIEDRVIGGLLRLYTLQKAFDIFCDNQDLISSQYECTFKTVSGGSCRGGVEDLLQTAANKLGRRTSFSVCKEMKKAVSCRLENQLKQCSPEFVSVMEQFYENLLGPTCYPDGFRPNAASDIMTCFANYSLGMQERFATYGRNPNFMSIIGTEMEHVCNNEVESITDCMYNIYSNPRKPQDVFSAKLFAARNIKPFVKRACSLAPALKSNLPCVIHGFEILANQSMNCLTEYTEKVARIMTGTMVADADKVAGEMCGLMGTLVPCMTPVFSTCDVSLGNEIKALLSEVKAACNNPNYQMSDGISSASSYSIMTILYLFIGLTYHVL